MVDVIADKKAEDIVLLDIREQSVVADYFIICSGTSERHLKALVEGLMRETKTQYQVKPWYVEGQADTGWLLLDYGDVMVHAFEPRVRHYYDLDGLWRESPVLLKMQ
jgi:ribosome-associated protein